jgi:hypothetical protein
VLPKVPPKNKALSTKEVRMSSLLISVLPTLLSVWTLTATNPVTGKTWDRHLLPSCEELIPESLKSRWQLRPDFIPVNLDSILVPCFFTRQGKEVTVSYECGGTNLESSADRNGRSTIDEKSIAEWLADQPSESVNEKLGELHIHIQDDDTPCKVRLSWPKADGIENARRFMKDILAAATPAVVGKPKLEAVYLDPQSAAGRAFFTSPEAWKKESAGLDGFITLPAGLPKVVDGKDFPGLPQGKVGLVGLCSIGDGGIVHNEALPGLQRVLVEAPRVAPMCPQLTTPWLDWWKIDEETELKLGTRTLSMNFFHNTSVVPGSGETSLRTRARAYLREADGSLVSLATDELLMGANNDLDCKATLKKNKTGATLKVFCPLGTPDRCKKNPWWRFTQAVRVAGDKVTITHTDERNSGEGCEANYE